MPWRLRWPRFLSGRRKKKKEAEAAAAARVSDANAMFEEAKASAIAFCAPDIPEGARCYICLDDGDLVRDCACRGSDAGFAHIGCLVAMAESKLARREEYFDSLNRCSQCKQYYYGAVAVALKRAAWLRFAGRKAPDEWRRLAQLNLASGMYNVGKLDEAKALFEDLVAASRRHHGSQDLRTIEAEERLANTIRQKGGRENSRASLEILSRVHAWKHAKFGAEHRKTLETAGYLSNALRDAGRVADAEALQRESCAALERSFGADHFRTLENQAVLVQLLVRQQKMVEARELHGAILPRALRICGSDHILTRTLQKPTFLDPLRTPTPSNSAHTSPTPSDPSSDSSAETPPLATSTTAIRSKKSK